MDDLLSKLTSVLNTPEGQSQLKNIASMLGGSDGGQLPDLSSLSSLLPQNTGHPDSSNNENKESDALSSINLDTILAIQKVLSNTKSDDRNIKFLNSLRPLLSEGRQEKVDQAIKIMRLLSVLPLLTESGLLSGLL